MTDSPDRDLPLHELDAETGSRRPVQVGTWTTDFKEIVQLAGPAMLQLAFQQAMVVTNQSMAGVCRSIY